MEGTTVNVKLEHDLQKAYKDYFELRWRECIEKKLQNKLAVTFYGGLVTSIQDQAIISGATPIDIYREKIIELRTI